MKAARLQAYGDVDQFKLEEVPDPAPGPGEVLIKVAASALNPVDLYVRQGFLSQYFPMDLPAVLGLNAAGTISSLGPYVAGFPVRARVLSHFLPYAKWAHSELAAARITALA